MGLFSWVPVIGKTIDKGLGIVDKFVPDKDKANELKFILKTKFLDVTKGDPLCTRQVIALTFHGFMWYERLINGAFPGDVIISWPVGKSEVDITIGVIYIAIILFYYPVRFLEKVFK